MCTNSSGNARTVTVSIEHGAAPERVTAVLGDGRRLPEWAPIFAETMEYRGDSEWTATARGRSFAVTVATYDTAGVVDILRPGENDEKVGARFRAMPRPGGGSVVTMTMPTSEGDTEASRTAAMAELTALGELITTSGSTGDRPEIGNRVHPRQRP